MQKPVSFTNEGLKLFGMLHLPEGTGKCPAVLFCHGFTGDRIGPHFMHVKTSRALAKIGIASLRFGFRGSDESEGEFRDMTTSGEISDAKTALGFLARQRRVDAARLGAVGLSMGGLVAANLAGLDGRVRSVALWSAVADMGPNLSESWGKIFAAGLRKGSVDYEGCEVGRAFFQDIPANDPLERIAQSDAPVLIMQGDKDEVVPYAHAELFRKAASRPGRVVRKAGVPGADHVFSSIASERRVIDRTVKWFMETL